MERQIVTEATRVNDNFVEVITTISERMSNKEFYQYWANLTMKRESIKLDIKQFEERIENMKRQLDIQIEQIKKFEWEAKECEARMKGK